MAGINTNMISLNAQRNLNTSQSALSQSIQRLSSGLRVNSAKDDAAGLAIAERMNTQVRGMNVAIRNANDGISLAQTAEGALGKVGDMLQRMRELAVQSSNATNTLDDRAALDKEVQSLKDEINRTAQTTSFNGKKLLDGSFSNQSFQVGANSNANDRIDVSTIANATVSSLGQSTRATLDSATIGGLDLTAVAAGALTINGTSLGAIGTASDATQRAGQLVTAINSVSEASGVSAFIDTTSNTIKLVSASNITVAGADAAKFGTTLTSTASATAGMTGVTVTDASTARLALDTIDAAISEISTARAGMGALQSRFESVIGNLQISSENASAARGRIMDTDFAAETANMSRAQVLQQAGMAMLSQANAAPQNVLSLLR